MRKLDNVENVLLYKSGDVRISNSAQEAEQLRRQGWGDKLPDGVKADEKKVEAAWVAFEASNTPELEGENVTPDNPSGAAVPPAEQGKVSGVDAVMSTRDAPSRKLAINK